MSVGKEVWSRILIEKLMINRSTCCPAYATLNEHCAITPRMWNHITITISIQAVSIKVVPSKAEKSNTSKKGLLGD